MKTGYPYWNSGDGNVGMTCCLCSLFIKNAALITRTTTPVVVKSFKYAKSVLGGCVVLFVVCFSSVTRADNTSHQESTSHITSSIYSDTVYTLSEQQRAELWGLDTSEWAKYQSIMQGPRGLWTPDLDPIQVLGINAKTEAERNQYARMMARMEFERMKREGAFSDAYHRHYQQLLGDTVMYPKQKPVQKQTEITRYRYFIKLPCDACQSQIRHWIDQGMGVDIYFVEANNNAIKLFAQMTGISPLLVQSRQITLNHTSSSQVKALGLQQFPFIKKEWE